MVDNIYNNSAWRKLTINDIDRQELLDINKTTFNEDNFSYSILSTKTTYSDDDHLHMPWLVQLCWTSVFAVMIFVAIGGNVIVIWIVIAHRRMRTVTNYFLVNLSTADLLLSTLNCFFNFIYMLQGNWQFGSWYCTINNFMANLTVAASVFTLTGITCDRYLAIVHPLQPRMSKTTSLVAIFLIWLAGVLCAFPCLLYSRTIPYRYHDKLRIACIMEWPDGQPTDSQMDFAYQVFFLVLTYVVPIVLMIACYTGMGKVLWGSRTIGEMTQRQVDSIRSKRKVVKMFLFIVSVFGLCWLPYHGYFIYTHYDRDILYSKYVQHVYLGFYWFAMSNAMVNPLIYYWMNARFRTYFKTAMCGWQRVCCENPTDDEVERLPTIVYSYTKSGLTESIRMCNVARPCQLAAAAAVATAPHRHMGDGTVTTTTTTLLAAAKSSPVTKPWNNSVKNRLLPPQQQETRERDLNIVMETVLQDNKPMQQLTQVLPQQVLPQQQLPQQQLLQQQLSQQAFSQQALPLQQQQELLPEQRQHSRDSSWHHAGEKSNKRLMLFCWRGMAVREEEEGEQMEQKEMRKRLVNNQPSQCTIMTDVQTDGSI